MKSNNFNCSSVDTRLDGGALILILILFIVCVAVPIVEHFFPEIFLEYFSTGFFFGGTY